MRNTLILSIAMALMWMLFARQVSPQGFIVGYIFGFGVLWLLRLNTSIEDGQKPIDLKRIPSQLSALAIYCYRLTLDVFFSGVDVAKRVLKREMDIKPGVHTISTLDPTDNDLINALSGHAITITPGELVIDYEIDDNGHTVMIVHALDKESSDVAKLERDQKNRLVLIRRILGLEETEHDN